MTKHTEGPWFVSGRTIYALNEKGFNRFSALVQDAHTSANELEENARLMAAAPELLEALENLLAVREGKGGTKYHADDIARAAIAKAKGE